VNNIKHSQIYLMAPVEHERHMRSAVRKLSLHTTHLTVRLLPISLKIVKCKIWWLSYQRIVVFRRTDIFIELCHFIIKCTNVSILTNFLLFASVFPLLDIQIPSTRALCRQYINIKLQSEMYITHLCKFSMYDMVPTLIWFIHKIKLRS
jgi:hypothetical protein